MMRVVALLIVVISVCCGAPIDQLLSLFKYTKCQYNVQGLCNRGTVIPDSWTAHALWTQRLIARDLPLNEYPFIGSHNSFNDRADGYGMDDLWIDNYTSKYGERFIWAQQEYTMTDQLNLGIRELHLDPHWFDGALRLCHGAGNISAMNAFFDKWHIRYDSEQLGCWPSDRFYMDGLAEIKVWLDNNPGEVVLIHQDDNEGDTFNVSTIALIESVFGDMIFRPSMFNGSWPSVNEMIDNGTRIVFQAESNYGLGDILFAPFLEPEWPNNCLKVYECPSRYEWGNVQGESQIVGPFYDGTSSCGLITPETVGEVVGCGYSVIELDQISPALMMGFVWSWAPNEPSVFENGCLMWNVEDARWYIANCGLEFGYLCRGEELIAVQDVGVWREDGCPEGMSVSVPRLAIESWGLIGKTNVSLWML